MTDLNQIAVQSEVPGMVTDLLLYNDSSTRLQREGLHLYGGSMIASVTWYFIG